ncbi:MAG: hypothetical protein IJU51_05270 [Clostridia bacterium]|nr:hypothetical protein [Clostridia bacterium]
MTYKIEQWVRKITSPIVVEYNRQALYFDNGKELAEHEFDHSVIVGNVMAYDKSIYIMVLDNDRVNDTTWCGEEQVEFF